MKGQKKGQLLGLPQHVLCSCDRWRMSRLLRRLRTVFCRTSLSNIEHISRSRSAKLLQVKVSPFPQPREINDGGCLVKQCAKCPALRTEWLEANEMRSAALTQFGPLSAEADMAERVESRARRKLVNHSVGCESASKELLHLVATARSKRTTIQPPAS
jgi:hypothetical protein